MAYRSGLERRIAASLSGRGVSFKYEQDLVPYKKKQRLTKKLKELHGLPPNFSALTYHTYLVDFTLSNGVMLEAKGRFKASDRKKMLLVKEQNPDLDIRLVFQRDNKTGLKKYERYSDWCEHYGFKYCVGVIPSDWF